MEKKKQNKEKRWRKINRKKNKKELKRKMVENAKKI